MDPMNKQEPQISPLPVQWDENNAWLRTSDRLRMEGLIHALCQDGMNLLLSCTHAPVLDHYARMLVRRLRDQPQVVVEVMFPSTIEMLLQRFNQWLTSIPLEQARAAPALDAPLRVFVVNDAGAVAESELQVMARLAIDFPGVNARVVLVMDDGPDVERRRQWLGRRVVQWSVEPPDAGEIEHLLARTVDPQQKQAMASWLGSLGVMAEPEPTLPEVDVWTRPAWANHQPAAPASAAVGADAQSWPESLSEQALQQQNSPIGTTSRSQRWVWLATALVLTLGLSAVVMVAWHRADAPRALEKAELEPIQETQVSPTAPIPQTQAKP